MLFTKKKEQKYNEQIAALKHQISELKEIVVTQELKKLRADNARYKEMEQDISKVKLRLKDVYYSPEEGHILVKYEPMFVTVPVDADGNIQKNDFFIAVNRLRLLSLDDMKKISVVINNIKNQQ